MGKYEPMAPNLETQMVVCAAIRHARTEQIVCGARHFDLVMQQFIQEGKEGEWADADQGFIDQWGNFLDRHEAYIIAERRGQLKGHGAPHVRGTLFSEDLY